MPTRPRRASGRRRSPATPGSAAKLGLLLLSAGEEPRVAEPWLRQAADAGDDEAIEALAQLGLSEPQPNGQLHRPATVEAPLRGSPAPGPVGRA